MGAILRKSYFSLEIQSKDQQKFCEEPAIESVVSSLMEQMISTVEKSESRNVINLGNCDNEVKKSSNRRGQEKRRQCTASFKAEVIGEYESGMKDQDVAMLYQVNRSLLCHKIMFCFSFTVIQGCFP